MKNNLLILWSVVLFLTSCNAQEKTVPVNDFEKGLASSDVQLLDVRTKDEFESGHLKGSLQADWTDRAQFEERTKHLDNSKPVYVYCLSGGRSAQAASYLTQKGFKQVVNLQGGITAWNAASKPTEKLDTKNVPQYTMEQYLGLISTDKTTLVDFGAKWCPPCVKMEPVLKQVLETQGDKIAFVKVEAGVHVELQKQLNISAYPTFIVYKNKQEVWRKQGICTKEELEAALK